MFVSGELYLMALPHTIPHIHGELKEQYEVAPIALIMHVFPRMRRGIFISFSA